MKSLEIAIGTRLELGVLNSDDEIEGYTYVSQILEHIDNGRIIISAPIYESKLVFIHPDERLRLAFHHIKHGMLAFTAKVIDRNLRDNIAVLIIEPEQEPYKIQRRDFYRLDLVTDILLQQVIDDPVSGSAPLIKAFTKNISGSGVCVVTDTDIPKKSIVQIDLELTGGSNIHAKCVVMRNNTIEVRKSKRYELGMHFVEIGQKDQENLIRYIYEKQRILINRNGIK